MGKSKQLRRQRKNNDNKPGNEAVQAVSTKPRKELEPLALALIPKRFRRLDLEVFHGAVAEELSRCNEAGITALPLLPSRLYELAGVPPHLVSPYQADLLWEYMHAMGWTIRKLKSFRGESIETPRKGYWPPHAAPG